MKSVLLLALLTALPAWAQRDGDSEATTVHELQCFKGGCYKDRLDAVFYQPVKSWDAADDIAERLMGDSKAPPPAIRPSETTD